MCGRGGLRRSAEGQRPANGPTPRFSGLPQSHDGSSAFTVELHFSEAPDNLSYKNGDGRASGSDRGEGHRRAAAHPPRATRGGRSRLIPPTQVTSQSGCPCAPVRRRTRCAPVASRSRRRPRPPCRGQARGRKRPGRARRTVPRRNSAHCPQVMTARPRSPSSCTSARTSKG